MTFMPIGQTAQTAAAENPSADGRKHGETAVATKRRNSSEIAAWLAGKFPADITKAAVSRAQSHGVKLAIKYRTHFPVTQNGERLPAYDVAVGCHVEGGDAKRADAIADLVAFCTPAPVREIERWLAELSVLSASRLRDGFEAELLVTSYASRLAMYPADVARYALLGRSWKFFPAWAELEAICEAMTGPRRQMIDALSKPAPTKQPERREPTQAERQRIAKLVAKQFPRAPKDWQDRAVDEVMKPKRIEAAE